MKQVKNAHGIIITIGYGSKTENPEELRSKNVENTKEKAVWIKYNNEWFTLPSKFDINEFEEYIKTEQSKSEILQTIAYMKNYIKIHEKLSYLNDCMIDNGISFVKGEEINIVIEGVRIKISNQ